jgi:hypothetical protein
VTNAHVEPLARARHERVREQHVARQRSALRLCARSLAPRARLQIRRRLLASLPHAAGPRVAALHRHVARQAADLDLVPRLPQDAHEHSSPTPLPVRVVVVAMDSPRRAADGGQAAARKRRPAGAATRYVRAAVVQDRNRHRSACRGAHLRVHGLLHVRCPRRRRERCDVAGRRSAREERDHDGRDGRH